jgi:multidrug efflux system membrane fusion protein
MNLGKLEKFKSWLVSAAIAAAIAVWLLTGQGSAETEAGTASVDAAPDAPTRTTVRVRDQVAEEVTRIININGKTAPARIVELNAETDGRVVSVGGERGERLDVGEVIVKLDLRDREARQSQAKAIVRQRELEFAARDKLMNQSYVSEAQLQEAAALLEAAKAELARAEVDLQAMVLRAPFDGALQERMVEVGDYVKNGDPVASFVDERTLVVSANVSEFDAHNVEKGKPGSARLATGEVVNGVIRYVAPVADEATRTFTVELLIDNSDGLYRGGITAELMIPADTIYAHKVSPSLLTLDDEGNLGIKIVNGTSEVEFYRADIAMASSDGVWIAGLPHTATIITVGQGFVNAGSLVDYVPEVEIETAVAIKAGQQGN